MINFNSKIYVAGHTGLVGSAIVRKLKKKGYKKITLGGQVLRSETAAVVGGFLLVNN